jgi:hypothetical protein
MNLNKRIENRLSWSSCEYRGPLILHASSWPTGKLIRETSVAMRELRNSTDLMFDMANRSGTILCELATKTLDDLLFGMRGGVFGIGELVDVIPGPAIFAGMVASGQIPRSQIPWYMGGFALVLDQVREVPFVTCSGAPGLFGINPADYQRLSITESP